MLTPEEQADALRAALDREDEGLRSIRTTDRVLRGAVRLINHYGLSADPVLSPEGALEVARVVLEGRPR